MIHKDHVEDRELERCDGSGVACQFSLRTEMRASVVITLLESDFLEAAINDLVECRHSSVANCHATSEPMKHCTQRTHQLSTIHSYAVNIQLFVMLLCCRYNIMTL